MIQFEQIERIISNYFQLPEGALRTKTRKTEVTEARQLCHYFASEYTKSYHRVIGQYFGDLDYTTVSHSIKMVTDHSKVDKNYLSVVIELHELFDGVVIANKRREERQKSIDRMNDAIELINELPYNELINLLNLITQNLTEKYKKWKVNNNY